MLQSVPGYRPRLSAMLQGTEQLAAVPESLPTLRIGQLARLASVHVETLRYYEREGLLDKPYQHLSGYRAYPVSAVAHVQSIKRAQTLGFSLAEIRRLLKSARGTGVADEAAKKLAEIDATMADLQRARAELLRLVDLGCDRLVGCTCGQADCPTTAETPGVALTSSLDPGPKTVPAKRPGLVAGALLATGCAACCAPLVGAALAAVGTPVLAATEGLELGLGATAVGVAGIALARIRRSARIHPGTTR
jgi:MerR family transcriptional regulator, mercuric resistance operon regulatory protein